jgi:hypothetical protein
VREGARELAFRDPLKRKCGKNVQGRPRPFRNQFMAQGTRAVIHLLPLPRLASDLLALENPSEQRR